MPTGDAHARVVELHGQGYGRNAIARMLGVSRWTVDQAARDAGLSFDRAATEAATAAATADNRARRVRLAARMLGEAEAALDAMTGSTASDRRNLAVAVGILAERHLDLDRYEDPETDNARGMLHDFMDSLRAEFPDDDPDPRDPQVSAGSSPAQIVPLSDRPSEGKRAS